MPNEMYELLVTTKSQCTYEELIEILKMLTKEDNTLNPHELMDGLNTNDSAELATEKYVMSVKRYYPLDKY